MNKVNMHLCELMIVQKAICCYGHEKGKEIKILLALSEATNKRKNHILFT